MLYLHLESNHLVFFNIPGLYQNIFKKLKISKLPTPKD